MTEGCPPNEVEMVDLIVSWQEDESIDSAKAILTHFEKNIFSLSRKFVCQGEVSRDDLAQVGRIALMDTLPKFDPTRLNGKLWSFFSKYVYGAMNKAFKTESVRATNTDQIQEMGSDTPAESTETIPEPGIAKAVAFVAATLASGQFWDSTIQKNGSAVLDLASKNSGISEIAHSLGVPEDTAMRHKNRVCGWILVSRLVMQLVDYEELINGRKQLSEESLLADVNGLLRKSTRKGIFSEMHPVRIEPLRILLDRLGDWLGSGADKQIEDRRRA